MRLEDFINTNYDKLNENDKAIWAYINEHRQLCERLSITALAERCHVSRTTILRFAKRLGLKGYTELKVHLRIDNAGSHEAQTGLDHVYTTYKEYMDEIKQKDFTNIIEYIRKAENAYVYGTGSIQNNVAMEIKRSFLFMDKLFFNITSANESYIYADVITQKDVIIMISFSGENAQLLEFAKKLKMKGVPIISITATKNNTLTYMANEALYVEVPDLLNPLGSRYQGLVNYFILIDFIVVKYMDYHERMVAHDT